MKDVTMGNQQATEAELGWLAGIYDGDGYFGLSRQNSKKVRSIRPEAQLVNCDPDVIVKAVRILNKIGINPYIRDRIHNKKAWSRNYIVMMSKFSDVKKFIDTVGHLITGAKKARIDLMIELINSRLTKTRFDQYSEYELSLVDKFFTCLKGIQIKGNTHHNRSLNDYQQNARLEILAKV